MSLCPVGWRICVVNGSGAKTHFSEVGSEQEVRLFLRQLRKERGWEPQPWEKVRAGIWTCKVGGKWDDRVFVQRREGG